MVWPFSTDINLMTTFHIIASEKAVPSKTAEFLNLFAHFSEHYVDVCSF